MNEARSERARLLVAGGTPAVLAVGQVDGACRVIFSAAVLDAEPSAAVQVKQKIGWVALSGSRTAP